MGFIGFILKLLFILATVGLMAVPLILEYVSFRHDKKKKIAHLRLRIAVYTVIYAIAVTLAVYLLKELILLIRIPDAAQQFIAKLALGDRVAYYGKVLIVILVNFIIGYAYRIISKFVRINLKQNLTVPKKENGEFSWRQKVERRAIRFFFKETWFFVGRILNWVSIILSSIYAVVFIVYQIPAVFAPSWIPFDFISMLFSAGYVYPTITLLVLWETVFFLKGIELVEKECPEILASIAGEQPKGAADIKDIDGEIRKQLKDYYSCDVDVPAPAAVKEPQKYKGLTELVALSLEKDERNPRVRKELYLDCMERITNTDKSMLINGTLFSEFSMYLIRYLSVIAARGDNILFVCNNEAQINDVHSYLEKGLSEFYSIYCSAGSKTGASYDYLQNGGSSDAASRFGGIDVGTGPDFDNPIWRIVKISGEKDVIADAAVDESSILVTSLSYLCSKRFESEHREFVHLLDTIIFADTLNTVNMFNRQLAMFNTELKHIRKSNALLAKDGEKNKGFKVEYMSKQVRYICFDDTRTPDLDKVLKNLLGVEFESADAMSYGENALVRCYNYEGRPDENGIRSCPDPLNTGEETGALMGAAVFALDKGASSVTVLADGMIPYADIKESLDANAGKLPVKVNGNSIRLNEHCFNPDENTVLLVMDSGDNLPAALRRAASMVSDKPSLVIIFSRPYMMRDYYADKADEIWKGMQLERIPIEQGAERNVAQQILIKANAGGISEDEILGLASCVKRFEKSVKGRNVNEILSAVLEIYGFSSDSLNSMFEYSSSRDFDENGEYNPVNRVLLKKHGALYDTISGRNMVIMRTGEAGNGITLPLPKCRLTQNYIAGQNFIYNGSVYHINRIDPSAGIIYASLASGGKNNAACMYVQKREYHVELNSEYAEAVSPAKSVSMERSEGDVCVNGATISVFRAPMDVFTPGYFAADPHTLSINYGDAEYHSINNGGDNDYAIQTYRRYGVVNEPVYGSDETIGNISLPNKSGALMMSIGIKGQFGDDINKTMLLATVMLNELIHTMFPSVADSVVVCPILRGEMSGADAEEILRKQPCVVFKGESNLIPDSDFNIVIIEDCATDLGVISALVSSGSDVLKTLFAPVFEYLEWYLSAEKKSDYLYFGLGHEPECFDFNSLRSLAKLLGDDRHNLKYVDLKPIAERAVCDFCGKKHIKGENLTELDDGRKICKACAESIVGHNKKALRAYLDGARAFMESTYGISLDNSYEFCFESTVKVVNALKQNRGVVGRGADIPLRSYIDGKKRVFVENSIPQVSICELLVRELTYVWQLKNMPDVSGNPEMEELAEGHIALVGVQYLKFLNQSSLVNARTSYYESTGSVSGDGYRKLVRLLLDNPQFNNNPFRLLLEKSGETAGEAFSAQTLKPIGEAEYGAPYITEQRDRAKEGGLSYFYYSRLPEEMRKAYDLLLNAIQNHEESVTAEGISFETLKILHGAIEYDHPELFWLKSFAFDGRRVSVNYCASESETAVMQRRIDEAVAGYLDGIDDSMSAYDVALRLHVKVITSVDYDTIALNRQKSEGGPEEGKIDYLRTICGPFIEGKAVCEGYARAMQYLLQKCGVECAEVVGDIRKGPNRNGGPHAWNIIKIDGDYYHLDTTWDDSSNTIQSVKKNNLGFDYFCVTTEEIMRTREIDTSIVDVPNCFATKANYYSHNGFVIEEYNLNTIKSIAQAAAAGKRGSFTFKCKSELLYEQVKTELLSVGDACGEVLKCAAKADKSISVSSYSYTYDDNIRTITVYFKPAS